MVEGDPKGRGSSIAKASKRSPLKTVEQSARRQAEPKNSMQPDIEVLGKPKRKSPRKPLKSQVTQQRLCDVLNYTAKGLSAKEVSKITGVGERHVERLRSQAKTWLAEVEQVAGFKELKADLFDAAQLKILKSAMSDEKLDAADFKSLAYGLGTIHKAGRLERGLSTTNSASLNTFVHMDVSGDSEG